MQPPACVTSPLGRFAQGAYLCFMIELRNVSKAFGSQQVLQDISFQIRPGEKLCIIGQSGSGKSVLMKIITGLLTADSGEVLIEGRDVKSLDRRGWNELLQNFGVVFQGSALFDSLDVYENVAIRLIEERKTPVAEIRRRVEEALRAVGLQPAEMMHKFPAELSGGMQKRVAVARAIIHLPTYVFYDEPTTGLDPLSSEKVDELIESLSTEKNRTSIIITHDLATVKKIATHVLMIHECRLHFNGSAADLFASQDAVVRRFLERSFLHAGA